MPPTRILVTDMPRLQREIVTELLNAQRNVEVVATVSRPEEIREAAQRSNAEVVILGRDDPQAAGVLLSQLPRIVVLTVADGDAIAWRYGLTPYRERLGELSPAALTAGIHEREQPPPWWTSQEPGL